MNTMNTATPAPAIDPEVMQRVLQSIAAFKPFDPAAPAPQAVGVDRPASCLS